MGSAMSFTENDRPRILRTLSARNVKYLKYTSRPRLKMTDPARVRTDLTLFLRGKPPIRQPET